MSTYLYSPINYLYNTYTWIVDYLRGNRQVPKITYIRCFNCHSEDIMNKGGSLNDIKSKYCYDCYNTLLRDAMQKILRKF